MSGTVHGALRLGVIPIDHGSMDRPAMLQIYHRRYPDAVVLASGTGSSLAMVATTQAGDLHGAILCLSPR
jgi:hypothetical protein